MLLDGARRELERLSLYRMQQRPHGLIGHANNIIEWVRRERASDYFCLGNSVNPGWSDWPSAHKYQSFLYDMVLS